MSARLALCSFLLVTAAARAVAQCNNGFIFVSTLDISGFASSSTLDPITKTATLNVESLNGGGTVRAFGGRVYVVTDFNRLYMLDPCNNFDAIFSPLGTGSPSGPRDVLVVSPICYLTRYERSTILKVNTNTGLFAGEINLAALADADGLPEMNQMFAYGGRWYVCLERVTHSNSNPTGSSMLAVIDLATETLVDMDPVTAGVQGIPLLLQRPISEINFRLHGGVQKAYFSAVGAVGVLDGGVIECVMGNPANQSVILTETTAGGEIADVEIVSDTKGFATVTKAETMELIAFDPSTGLKIGAPMYTIPTGIRYLIDIEPSSLGLLVADLNWQGGPAGVRCFDMTTNLEIPGGPISMGYSPYDILVREGATTDADPAPLATTLGQNYPNPFNPQTSIPFSLAKAGPVVLRIYDVRGQLVTTLLDEHRNAGTHVAQWNGRANTGRGASTGIYFARLEAAGITQTRKLVLLK